MPYIVIENIGKLSVPILSLDKTVKLRVVSHLSL